MVFTKYTVLILVIVVAIGGFSLTRPAVIASDTTEIGGPTVVGWGVGMADILFGYWGSAILTGIFRFVFNAHLVASVCVLLLLLNIGGVTAGCQPYYIKYYLLTSGWEGDVVDVRVRTHFPVIM
jgi:hypothetical protein